ncbi:MAG: hypothetical protein IPH13_03325 [Planctomycetes bacterium]|nr:hypothetical protein [Planctomycetota bacterium]
MGPRRPFLFVAACTALVALSTSAFAENFQAQLGKANSKLAKAIAKQKADLRAFDKLIVKEFSLTLELILVKLQKESIEPAAAVEAAADALTAAMTELKGSADFALGAVESIAATQIDDLGVTTKNFRVGGLGKWDAFAASVGQEVAMTRSRIESRLQSFAKKLESKAKKRPLVLRLVTAPLPTPVAPGAEAPQVLQAPVVLYAVSGSSTTALADDGRLSISGTADPAANAGLVHVTILATDGTAFDQDVVAGPNGVFKALFAGNGSGLAEGNYRVIAHQGGAHALAAVSVP